MRSVPAADVRAWRAASHHLSHSAGTLENALGSVHSFAGEHVAHLALCARLDAFDPGRFHEQATNEREWTLYSGPTMDVRLFPSFLLPSLLACDAFRRESRLSRRKAVAEREGWVRHWGPPVLELLDNRPLAPSAIEAMLGKRRPNLPVAYELEVTLHALVGRGDLKMASAPPHPVTLRNLATDPFVFWKPEDRERIAAAPREGWAFLEDLALHYFRTAGPATRDDLAWWLNISFAAARRTIEDLAGTLEEVDIAGEKQAHFMLEEGASALRSGRLEASRRVALLPQLDPEARWSRDGFLRIVDPDLRHWLTPRGKAARGGRRSIVRPVLVGGALSGGWHWDAQRDGVALEFIERQTDGVEEEAERRAERLARLVDRELPALIPGYKGETDGHRRL